MRKLTIHDNKKYLMYEDKTPFFYLADTAWEMAHRLNREEIDYYLTIRKQQGFNALQVVALAELDGLGTPNAYGHLPLLIKDGKPDPFQIKDYPEGDNYWCDLDYIIRQAAEKDMFIALLPTWGDKYNKKHGTGPEIFNEKSAFYYGKWIGNRYRDQWNIIWILGGDRPLETKQHHQIIDSMAEGIKEGDQGNHLISFHPSGAASSYDFLPDNPRLSFHSIQSGHGLECYDSWKVIKSNSQSEAKPVMDMESRYEDFPVCFHPEYDINWSAWDVRSNSYWNALSGACGQTYGQRAVWCFHPQKDKSIPYSWKDALRKEAAQQMQFLLKLRMSRPFFELQNADELLKENYEGLGHLSCGRGERYLFVYSPLGLPIKLELTRFGKGCYKASWFNPRNGQEDAFAAVNEKNDIFVPNTSGCGNDWVLILDLLS